MGVLCRINANDTQFLVKFDKEEESSARVSILEIFGAMSNLMISNSLKFNAGKTVSMLFSPSVVMLDPIALHSKSLIGICLSCFCTSQIMFPKGRECTQKLMTSHPMQSNGAEKEKFG